MAEGKEHIAAAFEAARADGRAALMPFLMGGFPDQETANAVAEAYVEAGADLIELGVPYSDPLADGPVIHEAATKALAAGATLPRALETCALISDRVPVVPMVYVNVVLAYGPERFAAMLADAGAAGVIVPDLPLEEQPPVREALSAHGLALVPLITPTTSAERLREICAVAEGFVYAVSLTGVTGERSELPPELGEMVSAARRAAGVPVAVGFGISTPEQAAIVGRIADGVIVGSRLVRAAGDGADPGGAAAGAGGLCRRLGAALSAG